MPSPAPPLPLAPRRLEAERRWLEQQRRRYHRRVNVEPDPLAVLYAYPDLRDREVVGLIASALAYGNVKAMRPAIGTVLDLLGPAPAAALARSSPAGLRRRLRGYRYRVTSGRQLAGLLAAARAVQRGHGSLEACIARGTRAGDATALPALAHFVETLAAAAPCSLAHLLPHPDGGSACKRLQLYLRWMVRSDAVDPGGWRCLRPRQLLMPLDTHVHRTALARGWTRRRTPDMRTALEVTAVLRAIRPDDPLRYDFAVTRPGILGGRGGGIDPVRGNRTTPVHGHAE